jgi:CheY-like chemotaxis protein
VAAGTFPVLRGIVFSDNLVSMATILVAEDNADARRPLVRLLKLEGYEVLIAVDAFEAMASAQRGNPDLILLDVGMPPIDGLTFLSRLRETPGGMNLPVILVTGLSDPLTRKRAEDLGVKEFLVKSQFTPDELLAKVREHLRTKPAPA